MTKGSEEDITFTRKLQSSIEHSNVFTMLSRRMTLILSLYVHYQKNVYCQYHKCSAWLQKTLYKALLDEHRRIFFLVAIGYLHFQGCPDWKQHLKYISNISLTSVTHISAQSFPTTHSHESST